MQMAVEYVELGDCGGIYYAAPQNHVVFFTVQGSAHSPLPPQVPRDCRTRVALPNSGCTCKPPPCTTAWRSGIRMTGYLLSSAAQQWV